jgi:hypothetical protein
MLFKVKCRIFEKIFRISVYHLPLREAKFEAIESPVLKISSNLLNNKSH